MVQSQVGSGSSGDWTEVEVSFNKNNSLYSDVCNILIPCPASTSSPENEFKLQYNLLWHSRWTYILDRNGAWNFVTKPDVDVDLAEKELACGTLGMSKLMWKGVEINAWLWSSPWLNLGLSLTSAF